MAQALALAAVALCYLAALLVTRFHIQHVDFWGLWFIADHLDVREPASWYNGFYPVAFPIWIRATSFGHPIIAQSLATLGFALVTLAAVGQLARRTLGERWAVAVVLLVAAFPPFFHYSISTGCDAGLVALFTAAAGLLFSDDEPGRWRLILAGALLGLGAIWRHHGFLIAVALLVAAFVTSTRRSVRAWGVVSAAFAAVASVQVGVNLLSGHGPIETAQTFNLYKAIHGGVTFGGLVDVNRLGLDPVPTSFLAVLLDASGALYAHYRPSLAASLPMLLPSLLARRAIPERRRLHSALGLALLLYLPIVAAGDSERAYLPFWPLIGYQVADLSRRAWRRWPRLVAVALAVGGAFFVVQDVSDVNRRREAARRFRSVEQVLRREGVTAPEAFSSDPHLYFRRSGTRVASGYIPHFFGGWGRVSLWAYDAERPAIALEPLPAFLADCARLGIRAWVLDARGYGAAGELYRSPAAGLRVVGDVPGYLIMLRD